MKMTLLSLTLALSTTIANAQTQRITFKAPLLYPEGIAYNPANQLFYVSSVKTGQIGKVDRQGNYKAWLTDKNLIASFGMKIDPDGKKLWVCLSDPDSSYSKSSSPATYQKMARIIAVDLRTGKKTNDIDLSMVYSGKHFINDLCFDKQGNLYATNSFSPVIYKIDKTGKASVLAENKLFGSADIGLNGIVYHPDGFLLVNNNSDGTVLKVSLKNPAGVTVIKIDQLFPGADGMLLDGQNNLVLIQNKSVDKVFKLHSTDNWKTAKVILSTRAADRFAKPSTAVMAQGQVWVLNSKLNELTDPTKPPSTEFSIQLADLKQ